MKIYGCGAGELSALIRAYQDGKLNGLDLERPTGRTFVTVKELPRATPLLNQTAPDGRTLEQLLAL